MRSDSRAMAITMAPTRTASPMSWPPISRASTGTVAEATATCRECDLGCGRPREPEGGLDVAPILGVGLIGTVGNRPAGLLDDVPVLGIDGRVVGGGKVIAGVLGLVCGLTVTTSVADAWKESAPVAVAFANS